MPTGFTIQTCITIGASETSYTIPTNISAIKFQANTNACVLYTTSGATGATWNIAANGETDWIENPNMAGQTIYVTGTQSHKVNIMTIPKVNS